MSNPLDPWGVQYLEPGSRPSYLSFHPEAESFQPTFNTMNVDLGNSCSVSDNSRIPLGLSDRHRSLRIGFNSSPVIGDGENPRVSKTPCLTQQEGGDGGNTLPSTESSGNISGDWDGFSVCSGMVPTMPPLHARAHSDSQQAFNPPHRGSLLRPRSRSDAPVSAAFSENTGISKLSPCDPSSSSGRGTCKSSKTLSTNSGRPSRRSVTYNPVTVLNQTISESPEIHSRPSQNQTRDRCYPQHYNASDHSEALESGKVREPDAYLHISTPKELEYPGAAPLPGSESAFSEYSARQIVDMIKSGLAESPGKNCPFAHGAYPTSVAQKNTQPSLSNQAVALNPQHITPSALATNGALDGLPLELAGCNTKPTTAGVIKICDIPYSTRKEEVVAFLGRNARLVAQPPGTQFFAVHIIMERQTAKSMDCFVELVSTQDAAMAANRFDTRKQNGKRPRIGDRSVRVEVSSQEDLMRELLPRARCVMWRGQQPIITTASDPFSSGFQGFITNEELVMTVKYAENPNRSRFAAKHPQRTYESMITLLAKYPWWMTNCITLRERDNIFNATLQLVVSLRDHLRRSITDGILTTRLLEELAVAGLYCPGFSEPQRAALIDAWAEFTVRLPFVTELAPIWPFETLKRRSNAEEVMVMRFAQHIKDRIGNTLVSCAEASVNRTNSNIDFGGYHTAHALALCGNKADMALDYVAQLEVRELHRLLKGLYQI